MPAWNLERRQWKNWTVERKSAMIWPWLSDGIASERLGRSLHVFRCVGGPITGHPTMMNLMWLRFDQSTDATFSPIDLVVQTIALNANKSSAVDEIGDRLTTVDMFRKVGGYTVLFFGAIGEGRKPKQLQGTITDVECVCHSIPFTLECRRWGIRPMMRNG